MIKRFFLTTVTACVVFLSACNGEKTAEKTSTDKAKSTIKKEQVLTSQSWLNRKLPEQTLAYIRIPTLWNQWFEAKGDLLQPVQSMQAHQQQLQRIQKGIVEAYVPLLPPTYKGLVELMVKNMETPLEIAVFNSAKGAFMPTFLLGTRFENATKEQMQDLLGQMVAQSQGVLQIISDLNAEGEMHLRFQQYDVLLKYAEDSGRLAVLTGMQVKRDTLNQVLQSQRPAQELNAMLMEDQKADPAGLSFQAWVAGKKLYALTKGFLPPNDRTVFENAGYDQMDYLWVGSTNAGNRSEFTVKLMMPEVGLRTYIPRVNSVDGLHTAGDPRRVFALALPTNEQIAQAIDHHWRDASDALALAGSLDDRINALNKHLGFNSELILSTYGQKVYWISDDAGDWLALRIKDATQHPMIMEKLGQVFNSTGGKRTLTGVEINESHMSIFGFYEDLLFKDNPGAAGVSLFDNLPDLKEHTYWVVDGDYLVLASVPQILADRANSKSRQKLNVWLKSKQGLNWDNTVLGLTYDISRSPRDTYHYYLMLMQILGDIAKTEVDLFALPTASELALPKSGRFGVRVDSSKESLSLHISYEYSALEGFYTFGGATTFYVAIMAAYAVPAYRDYTIRAQIGEKMAKASVSKLVIAESYLSDSVLPTEEKFIEYISDFPDYMSYVEEDGSIVIDVSDEVLSYATIILTPSFDDPSTGIVWKCSTEGLKESHVPPSCKYNNY